MRYALAPKYPFSWFKACCTEEAAKATVEEWSKDYPLTTKGILAIFNPREYGASEAYAKFRALSIGAMFKASF